MTRIGFAGTGAEAAVDAVEGIDGEALAGRPAALVDADVDVLVALGSDALYDLVSAGASHPVLPVDAGAAVESVPRTELDAALHELVAGEYETTETRLLAVAVDGETYRALADVMVVTSEPARISEYGIHTVIDRAATTVDTVRADGVVVATPRGSRAYSNDARGPVLAPDADTVSVVPIAPFRVDRTHWGLTPPVTITVERDESDVTLLVDDTNHGILDAHATVELTWGDTLPLVRVTGSQDYFG